MVQRGRRRHRCSAYSGTVRYAGSHIDAFVWVKPPGESDGASTYIPNDEGKNADPNCDPTFTNGANAGIPTGAMDNAPLAGHWFHEQFAMLVRNAYPAIPPSIRHDPGTGSADWLDRNSRQRAVALSWSASSGATSYTVKRATSAGGPYEYSECQRDELQIRV